MLTPKPHQIVGAQFLASRKTALLADLPRVGKTGSAIMAADITMAHPILVITTASGRGVWKQGFRDWTVFERSVYVVSDQKSKIPPDADVVIVGWAMIHLPFIKAQIMSRRWGVVIPDEAHYTSNYGAGRTQSLYGWPDDSSGSIITVAKRVWLLSGTPLPGHPGHAYPMLRALEPERLKADVSKDWPDVGTRETFFERYCEMKPTQIGHGINVKFVDTFVEGRNLDELRERLKGFFLQRKQRDVGILEPDYETMPLIVPADIRKIIDDDLIARNILEHAERGETSSLEMHMGPLRRITGGITAKVMATAIVEELVMNPGKKIDIAYYHRDVGDELHGIFHKFWPLRIDGDTPPTERNKIEQLFLHDPKHRVMLGQIDAAGEALDFSSAELGLVFAEISFSPKAMLQRSLRVTNINRKTAPLVRVASIEGSIYESLQQILLRKWTAINEVLK